MSTNKALPCGHHHLPDDFQRCFVTIPCRLYPIGCNTFGRFFRIPCQTPESIPVGLGKVMSSPIARTTDIAYSCHAKHTRRECLSGDNIRHSTSLSVTICIEIEESFPPHGQQIHQANRTPQVLLRNLEFREQRSMAHGSEQRLSRFARLKVKRSVFGLQHYVFVELSVQRLKLLIRTFHSIFINLRIVDKGAPKHNASMRFECTG